MSQSRMTKMQYLLSVESSPSDYARSTNLRDRQIRAARQARANERKLATIQTIQNMTFNARRAV